MKDSGVDDVDMAMKEREIPMEREYQRVSISGEEKCGVRSFSLFFFFLPLFYRLNSDNRHKKKKKKKTQLLLRRLSQQCTDFPAGAVHRPVGRRQVRGEGPVHPGEVHQQIHAELL